VSQPQTHHLQSGGPPAMAAALAQGGVPATAMTHIRPQVSITRTHVVAPAPAVAPTAALHSGGVIGGY
jgi:hypothetical protein